MFFSLKIGTNKLYYSTFYLCQFRRNFGDARMRHYGVCHEDLFFDHGVFVHLWLHGRGVLRFWSSVGRGRRWWRCHQGGVRDQGSSTAAGRCRFGGSIGGYNVGGRSDRLHRQLRRRQCLHRRHLRHQGRPMCLHQQRLGLLAVQNGSRLQTRHEDMPRWYDSQGRLRHLQTGQDLSHLSQG